ncbi:MAG: EAL and HDOD domain-containing protein [Brevinema sp.]
MNILLGKQSILDRNQKVVAYELLFRSIEETTNIISDTNATANVVSNMLSMFQSDKILGNKKTFINIGIEILRMDVLSILPCENIVIEILETQEPSKELVDLINCFKQKKYVFALDDFIVTEDNIEFWRPILEIVDIVKVDMIDTKIEDLKEHLALLEEFNVKLLAEKVETLEMFDLCMEMGFDYFQGFFFTKPVMIEGQGLSVNIQGVMELFRMIQEDIDVAIIEENIKRFSDISISLLKIVNSSSVGPRQKITSIKQTIALLGKKAISQWLLLVMYSKETHNDNSISTDPIFLSASQRAKMAELIIKNDPQKLSHSVAEEGFLAGLLSLSEVVLKMPLENVLKELNVSDSILYALTEQKGVIGETLSLILAYEQKDYDTMYKLCLKMRISINQFNNYVHQSWKFSSNLAESL